MCRVICTIIIKIIRKCLYLSPCIRILLFSEENRHGKIKCIFSFIFGALLGALFYELIIIDLDFTEYLGLLIGLVISFSLAVSLAISRQIRCIALLSFPTIGGHAGRGVLMALIVAYVIAGPVANLATNGKEVARTFSCTTSLTFNLTKTRFELMFKPFQDALLGMKTDANEIKDTISSIKDVSAPLIGEIEGEAEMRRMREDNDYLDDLLKDTKRSEEIAQKYNTTGEQIEAERYRKKYLEKIETRCEDQLTKAATRCRNFFATAYDKCYDTVTFLAAWLLCWPMKLTFVCNILQTMGGPKACDPSQDIDQGFSQGYTYLKHSRTQLEENFKDVKFQYKIDKIRDLTEFHDSAKMVLHEVKKKKAVMDDVMLIFKRILAFIVLRILFQAQNYLNRYLSDIRFDNFYITSYFRKIDARRRSADKPTVLPLKKLQRTTLIDPYSLGTLRRERTRVFGKVLKLFLEAITITAFVLLDRLFFEILDIIHRHAAVDYTQQGHHDMTLEVKGTGMIATLLRSVVKGFNIKKRVKIVRSNKVCLPQSTELPNYYLYKIYGMFLVILSLIFLEVYVNRMRRVICGFYYRKREKSRVIFLYNEVLKKRLGFDKYMRKKAISLNRERRLSEGVNIFEAIRRKCPVLGACLKVFGLGRRKCLVCQEVEGCVGWGRGYVVCPEKECGAVYCKECWKDLGKKCVVCCDNGEGDSDYYESDDTD